MNKYKKEKDYSRFGQALLGFYIMGIGAIIYAFYLLLQYFKLVL